jgi:hypothetical protein
MEEVSINTSGWHFIATLDEEGTYNLEIETGVLPDLDEETADYAVHLFLQNEIGEDAKILRVNTVIRTSKFDPSVQPVKKSITQLKNLFH